MLWCIHANTVLISNLHDGNFIMISMSVLIATFDICSVDVDINLTFNILLLAPPAVWNCFTRKGKITIGKEGELCWKFMDLGQGYALRCDTDWWKWACQRLWFLEKNVWKCHPCQEKGLLQWPLSCFHNFNFQKSFHNVWSLSCATPVFLSLVANLNVSRNI